MSRQRMTDYVSLLQGKNLDYLNLACEMMMFTFGDIAIHSQCFTRILCKERVLVTTLDYQNWDGIDEENNDEWYNLSLNKHAIINNKVLKTQLTSTNDLFIWLENDIQLQIIVSNSSPHYGEDYEQWRIFKIDRKDPHIVVYSNSIYEG